ncbi:hypothetical protein [Marinilactibacillus psychrotolerans]|uniref:hypothetical protein n=1 Tax=Marinilactibacillus psychrotolerans TaxID=191770 RepID=UPI001C7CDC9F|nr:hypothetical protein [Marinilactibacillus psychrotolerans]GEQ32637.1 hypothetical protein B795N_05190 [Marinilactibacillus psychrotolerans]
MKKGASDIFYLVIGFSIGILILISPVIITGTWYDIESTLGGLLIAEFLMRTSALIIGLLVIYDTVKSFYLKK